MCPLLARLFEPPPFSSYRSGWRLTAYVSGCVTQFLVHCVAAHLCCVALRRGLLVMAYNVSLLVQSDEYAHEYAFMLDGDEDLNDWDARKYPHAKPYLGKKGVQWEVFVRNFGSAMAAIADDDSDLEETAPQADAAQVIVLDQPLGRRGYLSIEEAPRFAQPTCSAPCKAQPSTVGCARAATSA